MDATDGWSAEYVERRVTRLFDVENITHPRVLWRYVNLRLASAVAQNGRPAHFPVIGDKENLMATDVERLSYSESASRRRPIARIRHRVALAVMFPIALFTTICLMFSGGYPDLDEDQD